ncbi:MAG: hypothetical protein AAF750_06095 [Planctomycetota bacterium]
MNPRTRRTTLPALALACLTGLIIGHRAIAEAEPLGLPDWVKPGAQVVYKGWKTGTGGQGSNYTLINILHVGDEGILAQEQGIGEVLRPNGQRELHLFGGGPYFADPGRIRAGMAFVMPPQDIANARWGGNVVVTHEPYNATDGTVRQGMFRTVVNGSRTTYTKAGDPSRILFQENDRSMLMHAFDTQNGLMLHELSKQYDAATGFDKDNKPTNNQTRLALGTGMQFQNLRQVDGPWIGQTWPAWTHTVSELVYAGQNTQPSPHGPFHIPVQLTMQVKAREIQAGVITGTTTLSSQNPNTGQVSHASNPFLESANALGGTWMSPDALRAIAQRAAANNGIVDIEPVTKTTVSAQQQGDTVIFHVQSQGGSTSTTYYSLTNGLAQRMVIDDRVRQQVTDLRLQSMR